MFIVGAGNVGAQATGYSIVSVFEDKLCPRRHRKLGKLGSLRREAGARFGFDSQRLQQEEQVGGGGSEHFVPARTSLRAA